jgi:hypothetical protein
VIVAGDLVLSTVRTAAFHVPKTSSGAIGVPLYCQSPARLFGALVISVMNNEGRIGRPQSCALPQVFVSVPA